MVCGMPETASVHLNSVLSVACARRTRQRKAKGAATRRVCKFNYKLTSYNLYNQNLKFAQVSPELSRPFLLSARPDLTAIPLPEVVVT